MTKTNYIILTGFALIAFLAPSALSAQSELSANTPAAIERIETENLHFSYSDNVSSIQLDDIDYYSRVGFRLTNENGSFKRPQSGEKNFGYSFYTDGGGRVEKLNDAYMWGQFSYSRNKIRDAQYNATLFDPFRGTPFYIADPYESDWINQLFDMSFKAASPVLWERVILGVQVDYQNGKAAKQVDPRPLTTVSKFLVKPGVTVLLSDKHSLGAYYTYHSRREDGTANVVNHLVYPTVYIMNFPGFFLETQLGALNSDNLRIYNANMMGGGLEYTFKTSEFELLLRGNYSREVEDVTNSYSNPEMVGTTVDERYSIGLNTSYTPSDKNAFFLNLEYADRSIDGIHYVQQRDNDFDVNQWIIISKSIRSNNSMSGFSGKFQYMRTTRGNAYNWSAGADFYTENLDDIYYLPRSTQNIDNVNFGLFARKNFIFNEKHSILVGADYRRQFNSGNKIDYHGDNADTECYNDFTLRDFAYLSAEYNSFGVDASYSLSGLFKNSGSLFVSAEVDWYGATTSKELFKNRTFLNFAVGITF